MNTIPDTIRELLIATGVLEFDETGDLLFIGLNVAESEFFLAATKQPPHERELSTDLVLAQLRRRHIFARMENCFQWIE